jgi:hypothetical protein
MNFPGNTKLVLSDEALKNALEQALNATRSNGEADAEWVRIVNVHRPSYGDIELTITTDPQADPNVTP